MACCASHWGVLVGSWDVGVAPRMNTLRHHLLVLRLSAVSSHEEKRLVHNSSLVWRFTTRKGLRHSPHSRSSIERKPRFSATQMLHSKYRLQQEQGRYGTFCTLAFKACDYGLAFSSATMCPPSSSKTRRSTFSSRSLGAADNSVSCVSQRPAAAPGARVGDAARAVSRVKRRGTREACYCLQDRRAWLDNSRRGQSARSMKGFRLMTFLILKP